MSRIDHLYRMMSTATPDECALWPYARSTNGYGSIWLDGRVQSVHAVACEFRNGPRPDGHEARHACRNRHCANPHHLSWGTVSENQVDRRRDGTDHGGERNRFSKLTDEQALTIRTVDRTPSHRRQLAIAYGVTERTIRRIQNGQTYEMIMEGADVPMG